MVGIPHVHRLEGHLLPLLQRQTVLKKVTIAAGRKGFQSGYTILQNFTV